MGGESLSRLLAPARCVVLPSVTENFGMVVTEALVHRVPVIASTGTPWSELRERGCGFWVPPTVERLADAMDAALRLSPAERAAMGERGRRWMIEEFSWSAVARRMAELYRQTAALSRG